MRERLQGRRLQWFCHLERMEESAWFSICRSLKITDSFPRERPKKTRNEVNRINLEQRKANEDIAKDRRAWKSFIRNYTTHASMENRR